MSIADYFVALQAGFDTVALRPPSAVQGELARLKAQPQSMRALTAWCLGGAVPSVQERLAVAALRGTVGSEPAALTGWAEAFARHMDGGIRLDALPTHAAGVAWRIQAKLNDARPWRSRRPDDPWDAGWALSNPPSLRRLQTDWMPRRATLVLADAADHVALRLALAALWQRHARFRHPVRWLWVGGGADMPAVPGQPVALFQLAAAAPG